MTHDRPFLVALALLAAFCCARLSLHAQDNPLEFTTDHQRVGLELGLASVWQSGTYSSYCGTFDKGSQINPTIALAYDNPLTSFLRFEVLLGYQGLSVSSSYNSTEDEVLRVQKSSGDSASFGHARVDFENVGTASFSTIFVLPSLKLYVTHGIYVGAGASAGVLLGGTAQYTKNILSKVVTIPDVGLAEVYYPESESSDPYSKVYPEQTLDNKGSLVFNAVTYIGAELPISRGLKVGPRLMYQIPLVPAISDPQLKLNSLSFLIGLRMDLQ